MPFDTSAVLTISRLKVINANAISGPFTWGFPAITSFTGFGHALHRRLQGDRDVKHDLKLGGVAVVCHDHRVQASGQYEQRLHLTRNPLTSKGKSPSFVEEGRIDLEISLVVEIDWDELYDVDAEARCELCREIEGSLHTMRIAGGSIAPETIRDSVSIDELFEQRDEHERWWRKFRRKLLPGFAVVGASDALTSHLDEMRQTSPDVDVMDALIDFTALHCDPPESSEDGVWTTRSRAGWFVPIPVGYSAISPLYEPGLVSSARDMSVPFCFVETAYSVGQWISPHRVNDIHDLFWSHHYDERAELYLCANQFKQETR